MKLCACGKEYDDLPMCIYGNYCPDCIKDMIDEHQRMTGHNED